MTSEVRIKYKMRYFIERQNKEMFRLSVHSTNIGSSTAYAIPTEPD
jgi:hypothetical protein